MGVGQGNGAGPAAYAFLSAILIKVLATTGYGVKFTTALTLIMFNTVCSMFVDDCDLWQSATDVSEQGEDAIEKNAGSSSHMGRMPCSVRGSPVSSEIILVSNRL